MNTPRVTVLAGLFVAGGLVGAGVPALLTADDEPVGLVPGEQIMSRQDGDTEAGDGLGVTIDVYNPNERSRTVQAEAIGGWDVYGERAEAVTVAGKAWTAISFEVIPDCNGDVTGTFDLATDDVPSELDLTDDVVDVLDARRRSYCGEDGITLESPAVEARGWDGNTYVLDVRVPGHGRPGLGDVTIDAVSAGVPYAVEAVGLPVTLAVDDSIILTTRWVFDCDIDVADLADPVGPGGERPYEAMYLTTSDDIQIYADVSVWLNMARGSACADVP